MEGAELIDSGAATYVWRLLVTAFFVFANGFFVAAEFALVKVRATRIDMLATQGSRRARVAQHILDHLDHYLSACQFGITVASLILGWLAEPAIAELLLLGAHRLGWEGIVSPTASHAIAVGLALTIVTILHITVGEQAPKIWAIRRSQPATLIAAYPLRIFSAIFFPFIWFINGLSASMLRMIGLTGDSHGEISHDIEEIRTILMASSQSGYISKRQLELSENVLRLTDLEVRHMLVPRVDIDVLSLERSLEDNLERIARSGHSRFPLCQNDLDTVVGVVHVRDLFASRLHGEETDLERLARPPVFVSETQPLPRLIATMQREQNHIAFALDEHGSVVGVAFLEDALEHLVGTIRDEFDGEAPAPQQLESGTYRVPGSLALPEAEAYLDLPDLDPSVDTIGGLVVSVLGRLPQRGDRLQIGEWDVTVTHVSRRRAEWLRFEPHQELPPATE